MALLQLLRDSIVLKPVADGSHLVAHLEFHSAAVVGRTALHASTVGRGDRI